MTTKTYFISYPIHGRVSVSVDATSEEDAVKKGYDQIGGKDSEVEWETGYPCYTGWPDYSIDGTEDHE